LPGLRNHRRLRTSSGSGCEAAPIAAGRSAAWALTIESAMPSTSTFRYATEAASPSLQFEDGARCVWVEAIMTFSGTMPHCSAAIFRASSHDSSATPRLSTTTMASVVRPSEKTRARECRAS